MYARCCVPSPHAALQGDHSSANTHTPRLGRTDGVTLEVGVTDVVVEAAGVLLGVVEGDGVMLGVPGADGVCDGDRLTVPVVLHVA